jgi:hypothetical protein
MTTQHFRRISWVAALIGLLASGCGASGGGTPPPKLYPVTGSVKYKGQAVPGAKVMFLGDGKSPPAVGVTDDSGNFSLSSLAGAGAVGGTHIVAIVKNTGNEAPKVMMTMEEAAAAAQNPPKPAAESSLIPAKYTDGATSGLQYEVKASGDNHFDIELTD